MNNAPGLVRMPPGVIKMKKDYDVSIPVVMVKQTDGEALNDILSRNPQDTTRVVGEVVVKGHRNWGNVPNKQKLPMGK